MANATSRVTTLLEYFEGYPLLLYLKECILLPTIYIICMIMQLVYLVRYHLLLGFLIDSQGYVSDPTTSYINMIFLIK